MYDFQAGFVAQEHISNLQVMHIDLLSLLLARRRIGCRETVACDLPFSAGFSEHEQLLIGLLPCSTTLHHSITNRVRT